ncbi:DUF917 domain-containing protein [Paraburkholderia nemoris]|uniref:DUF917 domain-containing protein n=1 Tax=Paraburkholderia nemoris TaxID=2793076 RepID=UPI0038B75708
MLTINDVQSSQDAARGAVLLGTGGGGDPYVGELFLRKQLAAGKYPTIVPAQALPDDAFVISIAGIGAPTVLVEHLVSETAMRELLVNAEAFFKRRIDAFISAEIGGANSMFPLALSAMTGLPVIDGDGVGRAVPHLEMTTFSINGCHACPGFFADDLGNHAAVQTTDDRTAEAIVRGLAGALGGCIYGALYPMSGRQAKDYAVHGTIGQTLAIGRAIRLARENSADPVAQLVDCLGQLDVQRAASRLFDGKIIDVSHETRDGHHWGEVRIQSLHSRADLLTVGIQNEYTVVRRNGRTVTVVPDLIGILDTETAEPLTAEMLRYGARVSVIAFGAPAQLCTPRALEVVGPRQFGLDEDWRPFTELNALQVAV